MELKHFSGLRKPPNLQGTVPPEARRGGEMYKMTYNDALRRQQIQIDHYYRDGEGPLTAAGLEELRAKTKPCPFDPNEMVPIEIINRLVPRGGDIEKIMGIDGGGT